MRLFCVSLFPEDLDSNDETDDESSTSSDDGLPVSDVENVQNDVVVKLEEITDWDENNPQTAESPSTDGPTVSSDLEDVQNFVVKIEEVAEWEDISSPQNPSTDSPISDSDVQNVEVKMEEISDWEEYNHGAKRLFPLVLHSQRECQRECVIKNSLAPWYNQEY